MTDDNALVSANHFAFKDALDEQELDYHIGVGVEDDGCFLGDHGYIDNTFSSSQAIEAFDQMADIYIYRGSYGANMERGFTLALEALSEENNGPGGCNEGFLREDAALAIIHVSDEPEQSVNPPSYYVEKFRALKRSPDDVVIHAIAGDYPRGCGSASAGTGYYEATVATGGQMLSICATDWGAHMSALAAASAYDSNAFRPSLEPVPASIQVSVDGVLTTGWLFDDETGMVVLDPLDPPPPGSTVELVYRPAAECE